MTEYTRPATWEDVKRLTLEGLLETKQGVRPKDQMDARTIRAVLEALRKDCGA